MGLLRASPNLYFYHQISIFLSFTFFIIIKIKKGKQCNVNWRMVRVDFMGQLH